MQCSVTYESISIVEYILSPFGISLPFWIENKFVKFYTPNIHATHDRKYPIFVLIFVIHSHRKYVTI